jgi:ADP-ribose pyrophosphatase YjhB (NUDIX family)
MQNSSTKWLHWVKQLQSIAQSGLTYSEGKFDLDRYKTLRKIAAEIAAEHSAMEHEKIDNLFAQEVGYLTPKLDMRALVIHNKKVLMVKEVIDGLWALPGGWCDVNESPSEAVAREVFEEAGFKVKVIKLLALYDKQKHEHPQQLPHAYKCFFLCDIVGGKATTSIETTEVDFFTLDKLPPLSPHRITKAQILHLYELAQQPQALTEFD